MRKVNIQKDENSISAMFDSIAPKYDKLNRILSIRMDLVWRKRLVSNICSKKPNTLIDIACGTGDLAISLAKSGVQTVVAIDISNEMLNIAKRKSDKVDPTLQIRYINCSADAIPYPDCTFDAATIGFGIRNFSDREAALKEIHRVLKIDGDLSILEFAIPTNRIWRTFYLLYFRYILPIIGKIISIGSAYDYLPESVMSFPQYEEFCKEITSSGFSSVKYRSFSGGVALMYTAVKR